ncbi:hypothetical protein H5410_005928 [Solanum commersonii]|uniref:Uncharacterized protein n=1 Tax=Solanum commersonii TaxID=4109 RepID=A0A9J6A7S0_SOLCO|nr:hypothetical protein H5410_005928 [Solanum commersonii]
MREARLRWFRHMKRRRGDATARRCKRLDIVDTNYEERRDKVKKYWGEVIKEVSLSSMLKSQKPNYFAYKLY